MEYVKLFSFIVFTSLFLKTNAAPTKQFAFGIIEGRSTKTFISRLLANCCSSNNNTNSNDDTKTTITEEATICKLQQY